MPNVMNLKVFVSVKCLSAVLTAYRWGFQVLAFVMMAPLFFKLETFSTLGVLTFESREVALSMDNDQVPHQGKLGFKLLAAFVAKRY